MFYLFQGRSQFLGHQRSERVTKLMDYRLNPFIEGDDGSIELDVFLPELRVRRIAFNRALNGEQGIGAQRPVYRTLERAQILFERVVCLAEIAPQRTEHRRIFQRLRAKWTFLFHDVAQTFTK